MLLSLAPMSLVQDPPRPTSTHGSAQKPAWPDPRQGVIEDARRRQHRRRRRLAIFAFVAAAGLMALAFVLEGSQATSAHTGTAGRGGAAAQTASSASGFDVRLAPTLEVGRAGWQIFYEEDGKQTGGESTGPALSSEPIFAGYGSGNSHRSVHDVLTTSNVASMLADGKTRIPTVALPGLPYGLRAVHIVTPITPEEQRIPPGLGGESHGPSSLVPLDAAGRPIPSKPNHLDPSQGTIHSWEYPASTPEGACGLRASGLTGLTAQGGKALSAIRPYPAQRVGGQIAGHAFLPCVSVLYHLAGMPLQALILLDAAQPGARAAALPDFKPVRGAPGYVNEGSLTARRAAGAWLVVGQGRGVAQRVEVLRHLSALVRLGSSVPASAGVAEAGHGNTPPPASSPTTLRVAPALEAGALGWAYLKTEAGSGSGGSCCSALTHPAGLLDASKDLGPGSGPWWTATVLAAPEVAAVSVEGRPPVRTQSGGLPYGMRFAVVAVKNAGVTPAAFDVHGRRIATQGFEPAPKPHEFEGPYAPRTWTAPSTPPAGGPCQISASGMSGLTPIGGKVVPQVKGYRLFESHAFQSCADTYYALGGSTLQAAVLLDAEHPGATPAALPYMTASAVAAGVFDAPGGFMGGGHAGNSNLTAERLPGAWLVLTGGSGHAQQLEVLRHLHAAVHL